MVLVPSPAQGHITPMLQLGSILDSKGFSITIAHTEFNSPDRSDHPNFTFLPLSDNLDCHDTSMYNFLNLLPLMNANCEASFEGHMVQMCRTEEVACVIYDNIMKFVDVVANRLKLPTIVLCPTTAAYFHANFVLLQLAAEKCIPLPESQLQDSVPNLSPLRFKDLPHRATEEIPKVMLEFLLGYMDINSSSAVIWNTVDLFDHRPLQQLQKHWPVPYFPIGPLHKTAPPLPTSLMEEDTSCLSWLDKQAPNSVIYVSLGSMATIGQKELLEMAWGLAKSEQPFLWVVRPSLLNASDATSLLPEDFKKMIGERRLVVKWAPQRKVLAHSAVGGFLTHCGWNSTLESLCEGVPLLCRPCFGDQMAIARNLTHVWKVGLELEDAMETGILRGVRTLMASEEGEETRRRALEMKGELERAINGGGSSWESLNQLVEFIISLSERK